MSKEEASSRRDAIEKAVDNVAPEETPDQEAEETTDQEASPTEETEEVAEETSANSVEADNALKLYRALNDPNLGPDLVRVMAEKAGLFNKNLTPTQAATATKTIKDVVAEELGPDFSQFTDKFSKILERILPPVIDARVKQVEDSVKINQRQVVADKVEAGMQAAFSKFEAVPEKVQERINSLMDEMPPGKGVSPEKYFDRLIAVAASETGVTLKKSNARYSISPERVARNKADASSRLASEDTAEVSTTRAGSKQPTTRKAAIQQAMREIEKTLGKG